MLISVNKLVPHTFNFSPPTFDCPVAPWRRVWITKILGAYLYPRRAIEVIGALHDDLVSKNNIYELHTTNGRYLLKIKDARVEAELSTLEELIEYLVSREAGAVCPLPDLAGRRFSRLPDGQTAELLPLVEGYYYYTGRTNDLSALGSALGGLHRTLADIPAPLLKKVATNAARRETRWRECLETIACGEYSNRNDRLGGWLLENKDYVDRMLAGWRSPAEMPGESQLVHGDLNRGNVFFSSDKGNVRFLDFEDAAFALMPLYMELGFVLQRFVFYGEPTYEAAARRLEAFFESYGPVCFEMPLSEVLRLWSYRSTVRLVCRLQVLGGDFDEAEMDKFIQLERQAETCEAQMEQVLTVRRS